MFMWLMSRVTDAAGEGGWVKNHLRQLHARQLHVYIPSSSPTLCGNILPASLNNLQPNHHTHIYPANINTILPAAHATHMLADSKHSFIVMFVIRPRPAPGILQRPSIPEMRRPDPE